MDYHQYLNEEQLRVVEQGDGPCLVLAGAGSGKTRTLIYRVAYLLEKGVRPENILLMTFTNKAAKEMASRIEKIIGFQPQGLLAGTFHKMGNLFLREYCHKLGYQRNFIILDEDDSKDVLKNCFKELGLDTSGEHFLKIDLVRSYISFSINSQTPLPELLTTKYDLPDYLIEHIEKAAQAYKLKKKFLNVMDFDDLLFLWYEILTKFPEVRNELSSRFQYVLIDEYQDTNFLQAKIINLLAGHHKNILVVGDDSQSIYSFRAAEIKNILSFPNEYPNAKIFKLETNYRSTPHILSLANSSIANNQNQHKKELKPVIKSGTLPMLIPCRDNKQQAGLIAQRINELQRQNVPRKEISVLYRSSYLSAELQLELSKLQIPYIVRGGQRYFEQAHIKDVLAYLRIILNIADELAWKRLLQIFPGIGPGIADKIWKMVSQHQNISEVFSLNPALSFKAKMSWEKLTRTFRFIVNLDQTKDGFLGEIVKFVFENGYREYLEKNYEDAEDRIEDLTQFINFVYTYKKIEDLLSDVSLSESFRGDQARSEDAVVLSTIHQAKGLEWEVVFIIGLKDGGFPHAKSMDRLSELEEERRLFYVAVTRAKQQLYFLYPIISRSYGMGEFLSDPSIFINELEKDKYIKIEAFAPPKKNYLSDYNFNDDNNDYEDIVEYD